jgi:hypothetical protein
LYLDRAPGAADADTIRRFLDGAVREIAKWN